jgi:hypothetical protein
MPEGDIVQAKCRRRFRCVAVHKDVGAAEQLLESCLDSVAVKRQSKASFVAVTDGESGPAARACRLGARF